MRTLVIDRSLWVRGIMDGSALLISESDHPDNGKMCCLGFYALECGFSKDTISGIDSPAQLRDQIKAKGGFAWLLEEGHIHNSADCSYLMVVNDVKVGGPIVTWPEDSNEQKLWGTLKSEQHREELITAKFAEHDVKVEFIN